MRIAVCLFGNLRNWRTCQEWWTATYPGASFDVFVHLWDNDAFLGEIDQTEFAQFETTIRPVWMRVQSRPENRVGDRAAAIPPTGHLLTPGLPVNDPSEFDSLRRVLHAKRLHEIQHTDYDLVIVGHTDVKYEGDPLPIPAPDTLLGTLEERVAWRRTRLASHVLVGTSETSDKLSSLFTALPLIRNGILYEPQRPAHPLRVLHFFVRMLGLRVQHQPGFSSILVPEHGARLCEVGLPMEAHETL